MSVGIRLGRFAGNNLSSEAKHVGAARLAFALGEDGVEFRGGRSSYAGAKPLIAALFAIDDVDHLADSFAFLRLRRAIASLYWSVVIVSTLSALTTVRNFATSLAVSRKSC